MNLPSRIFTALRTTIDWCLRLTVFIVPVYFDWFQKTYGAFDLNKSLWLHLLLSIALIAYLALIAGEARLSLPRRRMEVFLVFALGISFVLSTFLSLYPAVSLWGTYERQQGFHNLFFYLLLFGLIIASVRSQRQFLGLLWPLLAGAAFSSAYGVLQFFDLDFLRWAEDLDRAFSSFGQPNFFGHYVSVLLPLTIYAGYFLVRRWWSRSLLGFLIAAQLLCLFATYSRGAWIAVLGSLALFGLAYLLWNKKMLSALALGLLGTAALILLVLPSSRAQLSQYDVRGLNRLVTAFDISEGTTKVRLIYWQSAWQAWREAPLYRQLFGFGPDALSGVFAERYFSEMAYYEQINTFPDRAHNTIFDSLLQFGLIGFGLMAIVMLAISWRLWRWLREPERTSRERWLGISLLAALFIYFLNNLFSFSLTAMNVVLWTLLGISVVITSDRREKISLDLFRPLSRWVIVAACAIFLSLVWYSFSLKPWIADWYYMRMKRAEARLDCREVVDNLEKVLDWYWPSYYYQRAYLGHNLNCFSAVTSEESRRDFTYNLLDQAERLEGRKDFYTYTDLARTYSILGYYVDRQYYEKAIHYYETLLSINPAITTTYQDYGRMWLWRAQFEEAIEMFKRGLEVIPPVEGAPDAHRKLVIEYQKATFYDLIALTYFEQNKFSEAKEWYEQAVANNPTQFASWEKLARSYRQLGEIDKAIKAAERALEINPQDEETKKFLEALNKI